MRCTQQDKELLLSAAPDTFFTTDHYRGFPAVLARLDEVDEDELRRLLINAWRCQTTKTMAAQYASELG